MSPFQMDTGALEGVEQVIEIAIAVLSLVLLALSVSAYRRTKLTRLLYAASAFGLFAVQILFEFLEDTYGILDPYATVISPSITFAILALFFLAIMKRERRAPSSDGPNLEPPRVQ